MRRPRRDLASPRTRTSGPMTPYSQILDNDASHNSGDDAVQDWAGDDAVAQGDGAIAVGGDVEGTAPDIDVHNIDVDGDCRHRGRQSRAHDCRLHRREETDEDSYNTDKDIDEFNNEDRPRRNEGSMAPTTTSMAPTTSIGELEESSTTTSDNSSTSQRRHRGVNLVLIDGSVARQRGRQLRERRGRRQRETDVDVDVEDSFTEDNSDNVDVELEDVASTRRTQPGPSRSRSPSPRTNTPRSRTASSRTDIEVEEALAVAGRVDHSIPDFTGGAAPARIREGTGPEEFLSGPAL